MNKIKLPDLRQYVVDGSYLFHKIHWDQCQYLTSYIRYVLKHCKDTILVFDGYDATPTKDTTHTFAEAKEMLENM